MTFPMMIDPARDRRSFAPADDPPPPGGTGDPPPPPPPPPGGTGDPPPPSGGPKWWEADTYTPEEKQWLAARGLAEDDPMAAIPKMVKGHRAAEQRIGKGLDTIIDKPAKGEAYPDWVAKNREALGLPADEKGYEIAPPENWPKEAKWDTAREAKARAIGVKYGIPQDAMKEIVGLQVEAAMETYDEGAAMGEDAKQKLWAALEKDHGDQVPALMQRARRGAEAVAAKAGLQSDALANLSDVLTDKIGDPNTIRFMAAIGDMLGDDTALGLGKGGALTTTPADARAELATLRAPGGDYYKAVETNDRAAMERLRPRMEQLQRLEAGSRG